MAAGDLFAEALAGILQRPGRSALTTLGTTLGVGTFVAVLGLTATASGQIGAEFNALVATEVTVADAAGSDDVAGQPSQVPNAFPADADQRIGAVHGVLSGGVFWPVPLNGATVTAGPPGIGADGEGEQADVIAMSPGALRATVPRFGSGRGFDAFHDARREHVALLGSGLASRLGVRSLGTRPAVFIRGIPFTVIGIVSDAERKAELFSSVVVPRRTAEAAWGPPDPAQRARMIISTQLGAARQVAGETPVALRPDHPEYLTVTPPPDPRSLRDRVNDSLATLFLVLAGVCLVIGAVGIANMTLVAVMERIPEIGLRRSIGARGRHVATQFLAESAALGALGGLVGTSLGASVVLLVAVFRQWTPVIEPVTLVGAPVVGLITGILAGCYPALRAARIEPINALRR